MYGINVKIYSIFMLYLKYEQKTKFSPYSIKYENKILKNKMQNTCLCLRHLVGLLFGFLVV